MQQCQGTKKKSDLFKKPFFVPTSMPKHLPMGGPTTPQPETQTMQVRGSVIEPPPKGFDIPKLFNPAEMKVQTIKEIKPVL
jgi:hypothetical protein